MQPYRYLIRNKTERDFLLVHLKESFPEFYKWLNEFKHDEIDVSCKNSSFFCDYDEDDYSYDYEFSWCDDCSNCKDFACGEEEKMRSLKVIEVNKLMRKQKLERICNG